MLSSGSPPSSESRPAAVRTSPTIMPQKRRFSRAIAAGDGQSLAGGHRKAHAGEDVASAAVTGQFDSGEPHQRHPGRDFKRNFPAQLAMRRMIADDSLPNWHKPGKDLISRKSGCGAPVTFATSGRHRSVGACFGNKLPPNCTGARPPGWEKSHGFARQLQVPPAAQGRPQDLRVLQPADGGKKRVEGDFAAAVFAQSFAGEPASQRGRPLGHQAGHPGGRAMAQNQDIGARDRVPAGARSDAGFHRRARGGRSRRHARCDGTSRRRSEEDQSAGAGRSRSSTTRWR